MAACQVNHVDVIAHTRAIGRGIIVAEHANGLHFANRDLCDIRHEVIRNALRVFADEAAFVRANGIEVTKQHNIPFGVGGVQIGKNLLNHPFRPTIGVGGRLLFRSLAQRHAIGLAIHRGARAEHNALAAMLAHDVAQNERVGDVVVVVLERLFDALAHGFEPSEVNNAVNIILGKNALERVAIEHIVLVELHALGSTRRSLAVGFCLLHDLSDAINGLLAGIRQVVDNDHAITSLEQLDARMAANKASTAGDQDILNIRHICPLLGWKTAERNRTTALRTTISIREIVNDVILHRI